MLLRMLIARGLRMAIAAMCLWPAATGCTAKDERGFTLRELSVSDFSRGAPSDSTAGRRAPGLSAAAQANGAAKTDLIKNASSTAAPIHVGEPVIIDRVIGQVSGRPIFADEVLEPISDQLWQESQRLSQQEFAAFAADRVQRHLREVILNELYLAEAEASLTQQQQQGLIAFLRDFQERQLAESKGSRTELEQRLAEEEGVTLEEAVESEKTRILIGKLINEKISPRVIVSWRDVEREYLRRFDEFNPPRTVTLQYLRVPAEQKDLIEDVKSRLAGGEAFEAVAASLDGSALSTWEPVEMGPGGVSDIEIIDAYKPYLSGLVVGQTTQPIELENRTAWLHVLKIDQPPGKTVYQVQRQLMAELHRRRTFEESDRYVKTLFERGIYSEVDEMLQRTLAVAMERYGG